MRKYWWTKGSSKTFSLDRPGTLRCRKGLTLLEVMLAVSILTMGILVLLGGFSEGMRARKSALLFSRAIILTNNLMDEKTRWPYPEEGVTEGSWDDEPFFQWTIEVKPFEVDGAEDEQGTLSEIMIATRWREGSREKLFQLKTVVSSLQ